MRVSRLLWWALVIALFCLPLFAGLGRTDLQNDEAIYSYAAQSILETGDWLNPRSSPTPGVAFVEKPPLKFWLVALPIRLRLLPNDEFGLRTWDALFGGITFLYLFAIGRRMAGPLSGVVACLVLFTFHPLLFDHGLRSNNMEAALLLSYCGGMYHYLRWTDLRGTGRDRRHALAVGAWFVLGFMTKFVAVAFLPLVLGVSSLLAPSARRALRDGWRTWLGMAAGVVALVTPWFLYEMTRTAEGVWYVMLWEHVFVRFTASLDPSHIQPWHYYFSFLSLFLHQQRIFVLAVLSGVVLLVHAVRTRSLDAVLVVTWFVLPLALISFGTSKLGHYAYPFLPPVGLAVGFLLGSVLRAFLALDDGRPPAWLRRVRGSRPAARVVARASTLYAIFRARSGALFSRRGLPVALLALRAALGLLAAYWLVLAIVALVHPGRFALGGLVLARNPQPLKLGVNALLLATLAGFPRRAVRLALPVVLISLGPVTAYHEMLARLMTEHHPLRSLSGCLADVREQERRAGRATGDLFVSLPEGFLHPYFFYFRSAGWDIEDGASTARVGALLDQPAPPRPFLLSAAPFRSVWEPRVGTKGIRGWLVIDQVALLLPGPFARCESPGTDDVYNRRAERSSR